MPPDSQLLLKRVVDLAPAAAGQAHKIKFNLQRGMLARVLGFNVQFRPDFTTRSNNTDISVHFRTEVDASVVANPTDCLWSTMYTNQFHTAVGATPLIAETSYTLPKPYRTNGIMVQIAASFTTVAGVFIVVYYDVDAMEKGEDVQYLESTRQRGISRVA